jgi:hypothetical protein
MRPRRPCLAVYGDRSQWMSPGLVISSFRQKVREREGQRTQ